MKGVTYSGLEHPHKEQCNLCTHKIFLSSIDSWCYISTLVVKAPFLLRKKKKKKKRELEGKPLSLWLSRTSDGVPQWASLPGTTPVQQVICPHPFPTGKDQSIYWAGTGAVCQFCAHIIGSPHVKARAAAQQAGLTAVIVTSGCECKAMRTTQITRERK